MLRSLHGKLALALLGLLAVVGASFVVSTVQTSRRFQQEVVQKVNAELAARLVHESMLMVDDTVDETELAAVVRDLAMMNPGVELYVLDVDGTVLKASVPADEVRADRVDVAPIERFLSGTVTSLILGTDPRLGAGRGATGASKPFSAARIPERGPLQGYLYVVLADAAQESVAQMVRTSYVLNLSLWTGAVVLVLVFLAGYLVFHLLTRRVKRLARTMAEFRDGGFDRPPALETAGPRGADEVAELERTFRDMAQRIARQVGALEQLDALRRELLTNVSHDLRTPLAALQGYLETLEMKEHDLGPTERRRYLEAARKQAERLGRLVAELFELTTLESGATVCRPEPFALTELVQDVAQKFRLEAERRQIALTTEFATDLPSVMADIGLIERALTNLIDNALRHTPAGGGVRLVLRRVEGGVEVDVADTGRGIAAEDLPRVFDRYYRAAGPKSGGPQARGGAGVPDAGTGPSEGVGLGPNEGAGLGLAIVKRVLELHDSDIQVESVVGGGTTFRFRLPLASTTRP